MVPISKIELKTKALELQIMPTTITTTVMAMEEILETVVLILISTAQPLDIVILIPVLEVLSMQKMVKVQQIKMDHM